LSLFGPHWPPRDIAMFCLSSENIFPPWAGVTTACLAVLCCVAVAAAHLPPQLCTATWPSPQHSTAPHTTTLHTTTARHTHQSHGSDNNKSTISDKSLSAKNEKSVNMSSENFCLKWNDHHSVFFSNAEKLCHGSLLTDVVISAGGTLFQAHKLVLSVCSKFFQVLFTRSQV
jgi:hypothetical protein